MNRWASKPLRTSANDFLSAIRSEIPVSLIATPRANLKCERALHWQDVETSQEMADFDQVPLTDDQGVHIEGVFVRGKGKLELRENMLMAADAPFAVISRIRRSSDVSISDCGVGIFGNGHDL